MSSDAQKVLILMKSNLPNFFNILRINCKIQGHECLPLHFLLRILWVLLLYLVVDPCWVNFCKCYKVWWSNFILSHVEIQLSQNQLLKRLFFPLWLDLAPLSKVNWYNAVQWVQSFKCATWRVPKIDGGDDRTMWMYVMSLNCTLKNG